LWQVNDIWRKDPVVGPLFKSGAILTPEGNAKAAAHILKVQGPKAWATYNAATDSQYLGGFKGGASSSSSGSSSATTTTPGAPATPGTPGVDNSAQRSQLIQQFLGRSHQDPLQFAVGIKGLQDTPAVAATPGTPAQQPGATGTLTGGGLAPGHGASNALAWAASKIGNQETGTNSGGLASYANARFGVANQPWCAMFTSLAVTKGGAPSSARTASVAAVLQKAQAGDGYHQGFIDPAHAQPGDLIAFGTSHIGMVQSVHNGKVTMIAGNDSNKVQRRDVILGGDAKIVRPAYGHR
jgi:hypothetical protein